MFRKEFIIIILVINKIFSFKHSDICIHTKLECKDDDYKTWCRKANCIGDYNYQCGDENCANSKQSCEYFRNLRSSMIWLLISPVYRIQMRKARTIMSLVKQCPFGVDTWIETDICVREDNNLIWKKRLFVLVMSL